MGKKEEIKDIAARVGKTALGYVPFVGPVLSEIFDYGVSHFEQKKIKELFDLVEAKLMQNSEAIEDIKSNEFGYSYFLKAARRWMEESEKEKLERYAECICNGYLSDISETKKLIFLNKLSEYTLEHILLLDYLSKNHYDHKKHSGGGMIIKEYFPGYKTMFWTILEVFPQYKDEKSVLEQFVRQLEQDGFIHFFTLDSTENEIRAKQKWTTQLGDEFLNYIKAKQNQ